LEWWSTDANVTSGLFSLLFAACTAVLFSVVTNHVLLVAGDGARHWAAFARSMSGAFTATLLVSAALRGVVGHLVKVEGEPLPGIDVLRYTTALNYTVLSTVVMGTFALTAIALRRSGPAQRRPGPLAGHRRCRSRRRGDRGRRPAWSARSRCRSRSVGRCARAVAHLARPA
jgi:hypothetical protein